MYDGLLLDLCQHSLLLVKHCIGEHADDLIECINGSVPTLYAVLVVFFVLTSAITDFFLLAIEEIELHFEAMLSAQ